MEGSVWSAFAIAAAMLAFLLLGGRSRRADGKKAMKWPPGPPKLPIIGNMHQIILSGEPLHLAVTSLSRLYGPLITVWLGSRLPTVIVGDHDLAWEVLVSKSSDYAARHFPSLATLITAGFRTIASSNAGAHWHGLRRGLQSNAIGPLSLSGQSSLQQRDMVQMIADIEEEASRNGGLVKPFHHIRHAVIRLLARLCFGPEFDDWNFVGTMDELVEDGMKYNKAAVLVSAFPAARFLPGVRRDIAMTEKLKLRIAEVVGRQLDSSVPPPPNCYANFLLSQGYPREVSIFAIYEVFSLGVDSVGSTTLWAVGMMVRNQGAQQKLYEEIKGHARMTEEGIVKVEEVGKLEYLQAAVKETMRLKPIAPLAIPHKAARDTTLNGVRVAEGTTVMVNVYALQHDPKVWEEPEEFKPERFLDDSSHSAGRGQYSFLPFGAGMRSCAGMEVGKLQLAFLVGNLVKAFQWLSPVEGELPDLSEDLTFVLAMKHPLQARIVRRAL